MEKVRRKKMQVREKVGKSRFTVFCPMICGSRGSKSNIAKVAGAEPAGQMRDEKVHALVARSTFRSQNVQNTPTSDHLWKLSCRKSARRCGAKHISKSTCSKHTMFRALLDTFGSWDVEKVHGVVARSTFRSQNVRNTPCSDHFWKLRCRKSAHRCGAKHVSKSKCTKHTMLGPLLEVAMSKKCTPLWREAHFQVKMRSFGPLLEVEMSKKCTPLWSAVHFQVKMVQTPHVRTTFWRPDVEKVHVAVARNTFPSQKCKKTAGFPPFLTLRCRKSRHWLT